MWNIEINSSELIIEKNSVPDGVVGTNSWGKNKWGGPCPPANDATHHYHFKVFALDKKLELEASSTKSDLLDAMEEHVVRKAKFVGLFSM